MLALLVKSDKKTLFSTKSLKFYNIAKKQGTHFLQVYSGNRSEALTWKNLWKNFVRYEPCPLYRPTTVHKILRILQYFFSHFCRGPQFFLDLLFTPMVFEFFSTSNFLEVSQKARRFSQLSDWFPNLSGGFVDFLENSLPQKPNSNNNMDSLNKSWLKKKNKPCVYFIWFFFSQTLEF